jgi:hypothetical protein
MGVGVAYAHAFGYYPDQLNADLGVISRVALADVVKEATQKQEVGAAGSFGNLLAEADGLKQMTIGGEAMVGVSLVIGANVRPLGKITSKEVKHLESLHGWNQTPTTTQKSYESSLNI